MTQKPEQANPQRDLALAAVAFMIALVLWQVQGLFFLTYPLRLFVTMIHELGHGVSAILTGGDFVRFEVLERGAGKAYTVGGSRFVVIQAGYLGTAIFGAVLLLLTHRTPYPRRVAVGMGLLVVVLSLIYSGITVANVNFSELIVSLALLIAGVGWFLLRDADEGKHIGGMGLVAVGGGLLLLAATGDNTLTVLVGLLTGALLVLIGWRGSRDVVLISLTFLALVTGLQAITDSWILFKIVSLPGSMVPNNDASSMAREIGGSAAFWALVWIALDIVIFGSAVYAALIQPHRRRTST